MTTDTRSMDERLLPCPFCGGKRVAMCKNHADQFAAYCLDCKTDGPMSLDEGTAITFWNRRTQSEAVRTEGVDTQTIRDEAIEQCATVAENSMSWSSTSDHIVAQNVARQLRALKRLPASLPQHAQSGVVERDAKDYAIEFGGYLADAAYDYAKTINEAQFNNAIEADEISDSYRALQSAIYEFRKRRAALATPSTPAPVVADGLPIFGSDLGSQGKLREELATVLRACSQFVMRFDRNNSLHEKIDGAFVLLADNRRWNGPTGTNNED